jgi:hypothetical protein
VSRRADCVDADRDAAGDCSRHDRPADNERLRRTYRGGRDPITVTLQVDLDEAGLFFEAQAAADRASEDLGLLAEDIGRSDIRMSGKGHFHGRGEDADPGGVLRIFRRQHEGHFGIAELGRDLLHVDIAQAARVGHHGQRISLEARGGEDVDGREGHCAHGGSNQSCNTDS